MRALASDFDAASLVLAMSSAAAPSQIIDGSAIASAVRAEIAAAVSALKEKHGKARVAQPPLPPRALSAVKRRCRALRW